MHQMIGNIILVGSIAFIAVVWASYFLNNVYVPDVDAVTDCSMFKGKKVILDDTKPNYNQTYSKFKQLCYDYIDLEQFKEYELKQFGHEVTVSQEYQIKIQG